jgi:hypothetical protein
VSWRSAAVKTICTDSAQINTTFDFVYETYVIYHLNLFSFVNQYNFCNASPKIDANAHSWTPCGHMLFSSYENVSLMILLKVYTRVINNIMGCLLFNSCYFSEIKFTSTASLRQVVSKLGNWDLQWTIIIPIIAPV